jgi:predicted PurR-regulated permease PerM
MLYFGRQIFIPIALAIVLSFLFTPLVTLLERVHFGRIPAVMTVLVLCFALAAGVGWAVTGQLLEITGHIRDYKENLGETIRSLHPPKDGAIGQATATVRELNKELAAAPGQVAAHTPGDGTSAKPTRPIPVQVTAPPSNLLQDLHNLLGPVAGPLETAGIAIIFTAFMLIKREDLRNRLIRLGGQEQLTMMTQALDDASHRLSRYLLLQFLVNAVYGSIFGTCLYFLRIPHALLWGVLAALLRLVPYVGTLVAAAFPILMALAVFPGWSHAILIFGIFIVLEVVTANFLEPWLYGAHTGISSLAILVAAVFWSMLWGPVGLILSTPLTVCLLLVGRYVPQFGFLEVLLGDEPVLRPEELYYQRLLAMDQDEARNIAEAELQSKSLENLYETVLIPALQLAEVDRHSDTVGERTSEFIYQSTRELIDDFENRAVAREGTEEGTETHTADGRSNASGVRRNVLCIPARDEADELVGMMFAQLLREAGYHADSLTIGTVEGMLEQAAQRKYDVVCVSALPPFAVAQARSLCKRLRAKFPNMRILLGVWKFGGGVPKAQERVGASCTDAVVTTLSEGLMQVRSSSEIDTALEPDKLNALA